MGAAELHHRSEERDQATFGRPRRARELWLVLLVVAIHLPPMVAVGLRTDVGAHARFAEAFAITGRTNLPYYLFEQLTIAVRMVVPFEALERIDPSLGDRATIWDVSAMVVLLAAIAWTTVLVDRRLTAAVQLRGRRAVWGTAAGTVAIMVVAPVTLLTWSDQNLLVGYINITSYENPTVVLARPFGALVFWIVVSRIGGRASARTVWLVAAMSALAMHAKPSFTLCLLPAVGLLWAWRMRRGEPVDQRLVWGGFVAPSLVLLAFQVLVAQGQGGVAVDPFGVVGELLGSNDRATWWFGVLLVASALFPLVVALTHWSAAMANRTLVMAWVTLAVGVAFFAGLRVTGRTDYGDFVWGPQVALFLVVAESVRLLLVRLVSLRWRPDPRIALCLAVGVLHLASGAMLWYRELVDPAAWW